MPVQSIDTGYAGKFCCRCGNECFHSSHWQQSEKAAGTPCDLAIDRDVAARDADSSDGRRAAQNAKNARADAAPGFSPADYVAIVVCRGEQWWWGQRRW